MCLQYRCILKHAFYFFFEKRRKIRVFPMVKYGYILYDFI